MTLLRQPAGIAALALMLMMSVLVGPLARAEAAVQNLQVTAGASQRVAGKVNARYDVQFTTTNANAATQIIVTFPSGYVIGSTATIQDTAGNAGRVTLNGLTNQTVGSVTTNPATNQVFVNLAASTALHTGVNGFRILTGVANPPVSGTTGPVAVTTNASGEVPASATVIITTGALTNASVTPATNTPGATGNVVVSFTTTNPVPANGRIVVTFPSGFVLNSAGPGTTQVVAKSFAEAVTTSVSGPTVTATLVGGGRPAGSNVSLTLSNIRNPQTVGRTGDFTVTTQTSTGVAIDAATVRGVQIGQPPRVGPQAQHKVTVCHNGKTLVIAGVAAANRAHQANFRLGAC